MNGFFVDFDVVATAKGVKRERPINESVMNDDEYGEGYWERAEGSNYRNYGHDPGWRPTLQVIRQFVPEAGARLIEMACAKGYFVLDALEAGFDAIGYDISEYAISKAPKQVADRVFVQNVALPWPVHTSSTDIVCAFEFFEHVPPEEVEAVLYEVYRALKDGGLMWLRIGFKVPTSHPFYGKVEDHDHTHVANFTREEWESIFRAYGFEHVPEAEAAMDVAFSDRDWVQRSFVWRKPPFRKAPKDA